MKKLVSIVLLCAMLVSCFAGCGAKKGQIDLNSYAGEVNVENLSASTFDTTIDTTTLYDPTAETPSGTYSVYSGSIGNEDKDWYTNGAVDDVYTINTADELMYFFQLLNRSQACEAGENPMDSTLEKEPVDSFEGKTIKIARDMVINQVAPGTTHVSSKNDYTNSDKYQTTQITGNGQVYFSGTIDGQGHIISGLYQNPSNNNRSFFGPMYNATVQDLVIINSLLDGKYVKNATTTEYKNISGLSIITGGSVTFTNVYIDIEIVNNSTTERCGGFIGEAKGAVTMTNCQNHGNISSTAMGSVGGFIGKFNASTANLSMTDCFNTGSIIGPKNVGGIIGLLGAKNATLTNVDNLATGDVTYTSGSTCGGLIGNSTAGLTLTNCDVAADVCKDGDIVAGNNLMGGLIGQHNGSLTLNTCTFSGTVEGDRATGGLAGLVAGNLNMKSCTVSGTVICEMNQHKNLGAGGLIGISRNGNATVQGNTFSGTLNVTFKPMASGLTDGGKTVTARTWHRYAGAILGAFSDMTYSGKSLSMLNNTVSGKMKVVDNSEEATNGGFKAYAGIFVGCSNGLSRVEYIGNNTVSETFSIDTNSNVEIYKGGAIGGDMIKVEGYQISAKDTTNNTYNLRFVASTRGEYDALGFVVGVKYTDGEGNVHEKLRTAYASTLYTSIYGGDDKDGNPIEYAASDFNQKYLYTLEIRNVPAAYVEADPQTFGITLLPFGVNKETVESETTVTNFPGVPATYGTLPTAKAEEDIDLENVGSYTTLNALYEKDAALVAAPSLTIGKDDYKNNLYFGIDSANGGTDYCVYPSTNEPYTTSTVKNVSFMTYTVTGIEEGTYDLVLKLRVKDTKTRCTIMYLNDGQDAYLVGYTAENVTNSSATETENSYYVKVGTFTFGEGDTITFKIDSGIGSAMHIRGLYLMTEADFTEAPAAEE